MEPFASRQQNLNSLQKITETLIDVLNFGRPGSMKLLADAEIFGRHNMKKYLEKNNDTSTVCMHSAKNLNIQLPRTKKNELRKFTRPDQEIQITFSRKFFDSKIPRKT